MDAGFLRLLQILVSALGNPTTGQFFVAKADGTDGTGGINYYFSCSLGQCSIVVNVSHSIDGYIYSGFILREGTRHRPYHDTI